MMKKINFLKKHMTEKFDLPKEWYRAKFGNGYSCTIYANTMDEALNIAQKWWHEKPTYLLSIEIIKQQKDEGKN